jgi:tetratricopeptide (TPR) repeat protein
VAAVLFFSVVAGCARTVPPPVVVPGSERFPDYPKPDLPPDLARLARPAQQHERAWLQLQSGDPRAAERTLAELLRQTPSFYPSQAALGFVRLSQGQPAVALQQFDQALAARGTYVPALVGRGEALVQLAREGEAFETYQAVLERVPDQPVALRRVEVLRFRAVQSDVAAAQAALAANRLDQAREHYGRAVKASPESAFLHRDLADVERARPSPERPEKPVEPPAKRRWRDLYSAYERQLLFGALVLLVLLSLSSHFRTPEAQALSQEAIDAAVQRTLAEQVLPSPAAKVFAAVHGAIVRVLTAADALEYDEYAQRPTGSGVVIVNRGTILTSLHVVAGAGRIRVVFADGLESDAKIVGQQPENDLAVLQAETVPDDLAAATMRPKADLKYGDDVVAVGFPFGIGPSVSAGVVSGLKRSFRTDAGDQLSNLIQFDAAVNPGSSGGPLLNAAGEVVGIVTAMLDPGGGGFAGIGFAVPIETAAKAAGTPPF